MSEIEQPEQPNSNISQGSEASANSSSENSRESELIKREQEAWEKVLGTKVEVKPLPDILTPEAQRNLEELGFELRYMPKLDVGTVDDLRAKGVDQFLEDVQARYPNWKRYEHLTRPEKADYTVPRMLQEEYWLDVGRGKIDFPKFPGEWMAVETVEKPEMGDAYEKTGFLEKLEAIHSRDISWRRADDAIKAAARDIFPEAGLPNERIWPRMLEAPEWNLLANREGWGKTQSTEWTNTEYRENDKSYRVITGIQALGGAAFAHITAEPRDSLNNLGFRAAVTFREQK